MNDLRYGFRSLRKQPGFTAVAVLALALGIGGNTVIYSVVDTLLLEPLPFADGEWLVIFWDENEREGRAYDELAPAHVAALRERAEAFEDIAAYDFFGFTLTGGGEPEQLSGAIVEHNFFDLLGVQPAVGRSFLPEDDRPGAAPVILVSYEFWERRLGGSRGAIGGTVTLNDAPVTVVGVLPRGFRFEFPADAYAPLAQTQPADFWELRGRHIMRAVGKRAPGVSLARARAEAAAISRSLEQEFPDTNQGWTISVVPATEGLFQGPVRPALIALLGAVGFVLLIACVDVANLLLARATGRRREIAIRATLGARRGRLVRQLLSESLMLAAAGAAAGLVLAAWGLGALEAATPAQILQAAPRMAQLQIDGSVLGFTLLLTVATGVVFGLLPALRVTRTDLRGQLVAESRSTGVPTQRRVAWGRAADRSRGGLRASLVTAEVALALVLLSGAGLMIRSFVNQVLANPGFQPDRLLTFWTALPSGRYPDGPAMAAFQLRALAELEALPGVTQASAANIIPFSGEGARTVFTITGREAATDADQLSAPYRLVSADYFATLGIPLVRGRLIEESDRGGGEPVAVISQSFAAQYFAGRDPIGGSITFEGSSVSRRIVGVVGDVSDWRSNRASNAYLYLPFQQLRSARMGFLIRTAVEPASLAQAARQAIYSIDPDQPVYDVQPLRELIDFSLFSQRLSAAMFGILALVALILAAVGVYGVIAYSVSQRAHEIGVRMALGARSTEVLGLVLRQGMIPVLLGVVVGAAGAFALTRVLGRLLFEVSPTDPLTFAVATTLLVSVALSAIYLPARRAATVDPVEALRHE